MKILLTTFLIIGQFFIYAQQEVSKHQQFDFWVGAWDVNLRVRQLDNTWKDQHKSVAHIYSIVDGQAILELWEEQERDMGIIGYSLRYYDADLDQWVLWLNWPGLNRSGSSSLKGKFRHGRGEFYSRSDTDSTSFISRYTFSDITENSLRWDDAYSRDGGKTWTHNWIMEFSRKSEKAPDLVAGNQNHTNAKQNRCTLDSFDLIRELTEQSSLKRKTTTIKRYGVLEGCGVISILEDGDYKEFSILTFNTYAQVYEELTFDNKSKRAEIYYGNLSDDILELENRDKTQKRQWTMKKSSFQLEGFSQGEQQLDLTFKK